MISLSCNREYTRTISIDGNNARTSQRAFRKYYTLKNILNKIDSILGDRMDEIFSTLYRVSKNKKFTQNTILFIFFFVLKEKYGYKKDIETERYDTIFHTILLRIDEKNNTNFASKYLDAIQEKVDGGKIHPRTKKNLFVSILSQ